MLFTIDHAMQHHLVQGVYHLMARTAPLIGSHFIDEAYSIHLFHTRRLQHTPGSSAMLDTPGNLSLSLAQHRYRPLIQNLPSAETDHAHTETLARSICRVRVTTGRGQPLYAPTLRKRCTRVGGREFRKRSKDIRFRGEWAEMPCQPLPE